MITQNVLIDLDLSSDNQEVRKLTELVKNMPDIREDKIKAIKEKIQAHQYRISLEAIAESFINEYEDIHEQRQINI